MHPCIRRRTAKLLQIFSYPVPPRTILSTLTAMNLTRYSVFSVILCVLFGFYASQARAQSAGCDGNEDLANFNFGAANSTSSSGSTRTWTDQSTSNSYNVGNFSGVAQNTISFVVTTSIDAPLLSPSPNLTLRGNVADSLDLRMNAVNSGDGVTLTVAFNRPMNKLRFTMLDLDIGGFQDSLQVSGFLNGVAVPIATFVPSTPANNTQSIVGSFRKIKTTGGGNCGNNDDTCNVQVNFTGPVDSFVIGFLAGPDDPAPSIQQVAFNNFAYCVPKRELSLVKVDASPTFVAGATGTYTLSITNRGGEATNAPVLLQDVLQLPGVRFIDPQPPSAGFSCVVGTTTYAGDSVSCSNPAALAATSVTTVTLLVTIADNVTATNFDNKAKVAGGGDPNKPSLAATGPISGCVAGNEGHVGGGNYFSGLPTFGGCAFENTLLARLANLSVTKSDGTTTVSAGSTTTYTVTFVNSGPSAANNSAVRDVASAGLGNCAVISCTATGTPTPALCPATPADILTPAGTTLPLFPSNSSVTFLVRCGVTATGL